MQQFRDYEVLEEIGEGGMGVVFRAKHRLRDFEVALKVIHDQLARKPEARERFLSEARLLDRLNHPNILSLKDYFFEDDRLVITTSLLKGETLDAILAGGAEFPIQTRLDWLKQIIEGVSYAHAQDIIHRDLKPSNLFYTTDGQIKILDFGLGKDLSADAQMTGTGQILGTPAYLPPETYRLKDKIAIRDVGKKGDIFAAGLIAHRLLGGRLPFSMDEGLSATEAFTFLSVKYNGGEGISPFENSCTEAPERLSAEIMRCLSIDPEQRPSALSDLLAATSKAHSDALTPSGKSSANSRKSRSTAASTKGLSSLSMAGEETFFSLPGKNEHGNTTELDTETHPGEVAKTKRPFESLTGKNTYFSILGPNSEAPGKPQLEDGTVESREASTEPEVQPDGINNDGVNNEGATETDEQKPLEINPAPETGKPQPDNELTDKVTNPEVVSSADGESDVPPQKENIVIRALLFLVAGIKTLGALVFGFVWLVVELVGGLISVLIPLAISIGVLALVLKGCASLLDGK